MRKKQSICDKIVFLYFRYIRFRGNYSLNSKEVCIFYSSNAQADTPLNRVLLLIAVAHECDWLNQHSVPATLTLHSSRNRVKDRSDSVASNMFHVFALMSVYALLCSGCVWYLLQHLLS